MNWKGNIQQICVKDGWKTICTQLGFHKHRTTVIQVVWIKDSTIPLYTTKMVLYY